MCVCVCARVCVLECMWITKLVSLNVPHYHNVGTIVRCVCVALLQAGVSRPQRGQRVQYNIISDDSDDSDFMP